MTRAASCAVLELVLALGQLGRDEARLAGLAQAVELFARLARLALLGVAQRVELLAAEEIREAPDDLSLLRRLLLADANGAPFLGALEEVSLETRLELGRAEDRLCAHVPTLAKRCASAMRVSGSNGFASTPSATSS